MMKIFRYVAEDVMDLLSWESFIGNKVSIKSSGLTQHLKSKPRCYQRYEVTGLISQSGVIDLLSSVVLSSNTTNSQEVVLTETIHSLLTSTEREQRKQSIILA